MVCAPCVGSAKFFAALARANINIVAIAQGFSERSISVVVNNDDATSWRARYSSDAVQYQSGYRSVCDWRRWHWRCAAGATEASTSWLKNKHIDLRVCGVANSKALLTNVHGLNLENWQEELAQAKEPFNLGRLIRLVKEYHLLNPVM